MSLKLVYQSEIRKVKGVTAFSDVSKAAIERWGIDVEKVTFRYQDDEDDIVTISNDDDLQEAFQSKSDNKMLKVFIRPNNEPLEDTENVVHEKINDVASELSRSGDAQQTLMDGIPLNASLGFSMLSEPEEIKAPNSVEIQTQVEQVDCAIGEPLELRDQVTETVDKEESDMQS